MDVNGVSVPMRYKFLVLLCHIIQVFKLKLGIIKLVDYMDITIILPSAWAIPIAIAVFPVPGWPAIRTARPAIFPSFIISSTTPAARRARFWPTRPYKFYQSLDIQIMIG